MAEETKKLPINMLTAEELLENKGLKFTAWDEFQKSAKTLPKTGMKEFEPNGFWLQKVQVEKGIMTRKNLIAIERVDRISQLASAEWLPTQKRARVTKSSGQDWSSFGLEKNSTLYLLPEEALFLLEANCLELTWNDVPLSIQQAYELLIDNVECTLEEYRVYSQLVRYGYRIQRFIYTKSDEPLSMKRKVIVEPENGLRMADTCQEVCTDANEKIFNSSKSTNVDTSNSFIEICHNVTEDREVHEVVNNLLSMVENVEAQSTNIKDKNHLKNDKNSNSNVQTVHKTENKKRNNSKVKIISDETILGNIKIVKDHINNFKGNDSSGNWRASRIQRNVKLVPRRIGKSSLNNDTLDSSIKNPESSLEKRKLSQSPEENSQVKKSKHEVIELSDDDIQEVPVPMTRMELLNLIPNIAAQFKTTVTISRGYIPHTIKPHKTTYQYERQRLKSLGARDKILRSGRTEEHENRNENENMQYNDNTSRNNNFRRNTSIVPINQNSATNAYNFHTQNFYSMQHRQYTNFNPTFMYNRLSSMYYQNLYSYHRNTMYQNVFVAIAGQNAAVQNRYTSVHNFSSPNNNFAPRRQYHQRVIQNTSIQCGVARNPLLPEPRQRHWPRVHRSNTSNSNEEYRSSFKLLRGVSSWSELKTKWREEKTITIDDEDTRKDIIEDCNEVQVVEQLYTPLVGPKNANSLEDVFSKLQIIKSAPEKIVRKKKGKYKISYNVYSNTQNYRKGNPGSPCYRVAVIKQDDPFVQPIELHRLMQDAENSPLLLACVSMSISYVQPRFISVPNLT